MVETNSPSLADAVHAQLGVPHIDGAGAEGGREHWADGGSARRVVPDNKQLQRNAGETGHLLRQDYTGGVCGVAGVGVDLDDGALVHLGTVGGFIFSGVVGVDGVGLVAGPEHGFDERLFVSGGGGGGGGREEREAFEDCGEEVGVCALGGLGADFFVVEEGDETDARVGGGGGGEGFEDAFDSAVGHH